MFIATLSLEYPARECVEYESTDGRKQVVADNLDIVASSDLADRLNKSVGEDIRQLLKERDFYMRKRYALVNALADFQGSHPDLFRKIMDEHDRA